MLKKRFMMQVYLILDNMIIQIFNKTYISIYYTQKYQQGSKYMNLTKTVQDWFHYYVNKQTHIHIIALNLCELPCSMFIAHKIVRHNKCVCTAVNCNNYMKCNTGVKCNNFLT